jgi:hypothetical protein
MRRYKKFILANLSAYLLQREITTRRRDALTEYAAQIGFRVGAPSAAYSQETLFEESTNITRKESDASQKINLIFNALISTDVDEDEDEHKTGRFFYLEAAPGDMRGTPIIQSIELENAIAMITPSLTDRVISVADQNDDTRLINRLNRFDSNLNSIIYRDSPQVTELRTRINAGGRKDVASALEALTSEEKSVITRAIETAKATSNAALTSVAGPAGALISLTATFMDPRVGSISPIIETGAAAGGGGAGSGAVPGGAAYAGGVVAPAPAPASSAASMGNVTASLTHAQQAAAAAALGWGAAPSSGGRSAGVGGRSATNTRRRALVSYGSDDEGSGDEGSSGPKFITDPVGQIPINKNYKIIKVDGIYQIIEKDTAGRPGKIVKAPGPNIVDPRDWATVSSTAKIGGYRRRTHRRRSHTHTHKRKHRAHRIKASRRARRSATGKSRKAGRR